jgi:predicted Rossmann fold nucleotide-binding protein DprA/Smf involved in DNA uptake
MSRIVSGNIGDPETDKELDLLRQGLQLGKLTLDDLDVLLSIINHNFGTPATSAALAIQSEDGGELEHRQKIIDALKGGKQRIDDLLKALAITP